VTSPPRTSEHRLLVLRHGQAGVAPAGGADIDRPLSGAGRRASAALAALVGQLRPEVVLCSSALRTRQTMEALDLDPEVAVSLEPALYDADADDLLDAVREVDDEPATVLVIGHNPGVRQLAVEIAGAERIPSFPPATLAVLDLDVARWFETAPGAGRLISLHIPDRMAE
jgi:phosphohistidine phosphatase